MQLSQRRLRLWEDLGASLACRVRRKCKTRMATDMLLLFHD
jgi:hypothetical protein